MKTVNILLSLVIAVIFFRHQSDGRVVQQPKVKAPQIELDDVKMVPLRPVAIQIKTRSRRQAFGAHGLNGAQKIYNSPVVVKSKFGEGDNVLSADNGYGVEENANPSRPNVAVGGTATPVVNNPNNALEEVFGTANNNNQLNEATNGQLNQGVQTQNPQPQVDTGSWGGAIQRPVQPNNPWLAGGGGFPITNPAPVPVPTYNPVPIPAYNPVPIPAYNPVPNNPWITPEPYRPVIPSAPTPHWHDHFGGYTPSSDFQFPHSWRTVQHNHNYRNCKRH